MNAPTPCSGSTTEPAWRTYLRAILFLLPAFIVWLFTYILVLPTLESVWEKAGLSGSKPQWLMDGSDFFMNEGRLVITEVILIFVALEFLLPAWPRYRRFVVASVTFVLNTVVLVGLASLCTSAVLAAKVLMKTP